MKIRKARAEDVSIAQKLINAHAKRHEMIPRSLNDLYENLRDLIICEQDGKIVGVCALHVLWADLAEIRSFAVIKQAAGQGAGSKLVRRALKEARELGIKKVFALTYIPDYFTSKFGFAEIDKAKLPHKIWGECVRCHKFPDCDETAVIKTINRQEGK